VLDSLFERASGFAINENRRGTLIRLMDIAILDWFLERDPFAIHLLVCACYMVLADLGKKNGKGPHFEKHFGRFEMTAVYDFLRHAKPGMLNDSVDLPPIVNDWLLFDVIASFERLFNGRTLFMRTFQAYYAIRPSVAHAKLPKHADAFLPEGLSIEKAERLAKHGRVRFFTEVSEMFARGILRQRTP
jgi:hypothetical protein